MKRKSSRRASIWLFERQKRVTIAPGIVEKKNQEQIKAFQPYPGNFG